MTDPLQDAKRDAKTMTPELLRHMFRGNEWVQACAAAWEADQARVEALEGFWHDMVQVFGFDGSLNLDGFDFEEMAEKHGLIKWIVYNPTDWTDDEREHMEAEAGDPIWVDARSPKAALAAAGGSR
jgi:hypothetical protein